mmetsp:Transcript_45221/g.51015  ORF Transcript_45221/g.51015 Transcript_45221/m.51015 type:complete len:104 (+) Transcript_45221:3-314(+)
MIIGVGGASDASDCDDANTNGVCLSSTSTSTTTSSSITTTTNNDNDTTTIVNECKLYMAPSSIPNGGYDYLPHGPYKKENQFWDNKNKMWEEEEEEVITIQQR